METVVELPSNNNLYEQNSKLKVTLKELQKKVSQVGLLQTVRHSGESLALRLAHDFVYRPVALTTGQRLSNPLDGHKGHGTGCTTQTRINLEADSRNTLYSVSTALFKSLDSYTHPQNRIDYFLEMLAFWKWYLIIAINSLVATPLIRTMQRHYPKLGNQIKTWYASTPLCEEIDCSVSTPN